MAVATIRAIYSRQNARVKQLRAALERPGRSDEGLIGLEGPHLVEEAIAASIDLLAIFVETGSEHLLDRLKLPPRTELLSLAPDVFANAGTTEHPQPLAALARAPRFTLDDTLGRNPAVPLVLATAAIQDPGNLGTLVRSAEAFGATGVVLLPGTTSLWNPKTLRASAGSALRLPVVSASDSELLNLLRARQVALLAALPGIPGHTPHPDLTRPVAILIGNEGSGLPQHWIDQADAPITIASPGPVESLNAAVAGSILLYEASRQRAKTK